MNTIGNVAVITMVVLIDLFLIGVLVLFATQLAEPITDALRTFKAYKKENAKQ